MAVSEGQLLWQASEEFANNSNMAQYIRWLKANSTVDYVDYHELWQRLVDHIEAYWASWWGMMDSST
jgi:acetoacetyl-CoA synthetase